MYSPAALPSRQRAAPAKKRRLSTRKGPSARATVIGLPTFRASSAASSSVRSSSRSASFISWRLRSPGGVSDQPSKAAAAAFTARSTSFSDPLGTSAIVSSVAGLMIGWGAPAMASSHLPPTKFWCLSMATSMPAGVCDERMSGRYRLGFGASTFYQTARPASAAPGGGGTGTDGEDRDAEEYRPARRCPKEVPPEGGESSHREPAGGGVRHV